MGESNKMPREDEVGEPFKYNQTTLQHSKTEVDKFEADFGGTYIMGPLMSVFEADKGKFKKRIFMLTDGCV